jgi:hypothetical protein
MDLFTSPELYPLRIDFDGRKIRFLRMTPKTYRDSVFLDERAQYVGAEIDIRLDDVLLASETAPAPETRVHYILNNAFCGSTLLARYFELLSSCFVLKEPRLLAQLAAERRVSDALWNQCFGLCLRLLSRAYAPNQVVLIKPIESCNRLGNRLLGHSSNVTATFLEAPLRHFLLAVLKSTDRRGWICKRARSAVRDVGNCPSLSAIDPQMLTVPQAATYLWLVDRYLRTQLLSGTNGKRVFPLDGEQLMRSPREALLAVAQMCGLCLDTDRLNWMIDHPSVHKYSKDLSRPYDVSSRNLEMRELERCWGVEADAGIEWARSQVGYRTSDTSCDPSQFTLTRS